MRLGVPVLAALAALVVPAATHPGTAARYSVDVDYLARDCEDDDPFRAPLRGALLVLRDNEGKRASARLDGGGQASVSFTGSAPVSASVVLDGPQVKVAPGKLADNRADVRFVDAYELDLGEVTAGHLKALVADKTKAGAANIFVVLESAARFGQRVSASDVRLAKVTALWEYDHDLGWFRREDFGATAYDRSTKGIYVGSADRKDEWERYVLYHEYGHHVLAENAPPGPRSSGEHDVRSVYPKLPGLAWSEGFANAFGAIALNEPKPRTECRKQFMDVSADDDIPKPELKRPADYHAAQFNEITAASVIWGLARHLAGATAPAVGLQKLVTAARNYRQSGTLHSPWSMRELRDAIVFSGLEKSSPKQFRKINGIFGERGLTGWGGSASFSFRQDEVVSLDPVDTRHQGSMTTHIVVLSISGPGVRCSYASNYDGPEVELTNNEYTNPVQAVVVPGQVDYVWEDDCVGYGIGPSSATIRLNFPYLRNQSHLKGEYVVRASYACIPGDPPEDEDPIPYLCTADRQGLVSLHHGSSGNFTCGGSSICFAGLADSGDVPMTISSTAREIMRFSARVGKRPCSLTKPG